MTAHYLKLRIPTASVTATLLETVTPPARLGKPQGRKSEMEAATIRPQVVLASLAPA